ncbi:MAG TPA: hypothetical protein VHX16_03465 [Chloroflexota bacterium]|jgi:hypothetical protein|nr:hypothetical protein [Chloroflexota bacterium]
MASRTSLTAVGLSTTAVRALRKLRKRYVAGEVGETFDQAERRRLLFLRWLLGEKRIQV